MKNSKNIIYIGYTSGQEIIYDVAKFSIMKFTKDVECIPIVQSQLREKGFYYREKDKLGTTEFSITRFLVPFLAKYKGWVLYCDNDVLALDDINNLFNLKNDKYAVMCVKHDYKPSNSKKLDNKDQTIYPRKNWSSVVLWNCSHPKNKFITPKLVNEVSPTFLHRFMWLDDDEIGSFGNEWNWLVGWYKEPKDGKPKLLHFTEGGPYFKNYSDTEYSNFWKENFKDLYNRDFSEEDFIY